MKYLRASSILIVSLFLIMLGCESQPTTAQTSDNPSLSALNSNPRYFTADGTNPIYLTTAHTWLNFQDGDTNEPVVAFDYNGYLNSLASRHYNFIRLWVWEQARWTSETAGDFFFSPMPYQRTGPGVALDGKPKFDLAKFNQNYFTRLRDRVIAARARNIYVSVMLFNGWSIEDKLGSGLNNPWRGHPFNKDNNINAIDGDPNGNGEGEETHTMEVSAVFELQKAYIRHVVDAIADLDNVMFEISNESHSGSVTWQNQLINYIKAYEQGNAIQHPVGMTSTYPDGNNSHLFASDADWISPNGSVTSRPQATGAKVILADTDHLCGICTDFRFPWKSFLSGENPIFMDPYDQINASIGTAILAAFNNPDDSSWYRIRANLSWAQCLSTQVTLASMVPRPELASSGYCLATADMDYFSLTEESGSLTINLQGSQKNFSVMWLNPVNGHVSWGTVVIGGSQVALTSPFGSVSVVWLHAGPQPITPSCLDQAAATMP